MNRLHATLAGLLAAAVGAQDEGALLAHATWHTRDVAAGVRWQQARHHLFGGPQQISVLAVDRTVAAARLRVAAPAQGLAPTSALARAHDAVAAVNGGFFAPDGSPADFLVIGGRTRRAYEGGRAATLAIGAGGVRLTDAGTAVAALERAGGPDPALLVDALTAGPWLVRAGRIVARPGGPRHPRTAAGIAGEHLLLVTVDGRTPPAYGMTLHDLARTMRALGCTDAFNLDGGGSTTMWVRSLGGVVNCPCDDRRFDPDGERAVGSAVLVLGRPIWTLDEEAAALAPDGAFHAVHDPEHVDGDCRRADPGGSATFLLPALTAERAAVEVFARPGERVAWSFAGRHGWLTTPRAGWCALVEVAWRDAADRRLVLSAHRPFTVDAVRVLVLP